MKDYSNCVIYKISCKDDTIKDFYIGSTKDYHRRKIQHKSACKLEDQTPLYIYIRDNKGFANWYIEEIHNFSCNSKLEKEQIERKWIETLKPVLNKVIPTRSKKEYAEYYNTINPTYQKDYHQKNREKRNKQCIERQKIDKNRKHRSRTIECDLCGTFISYSNKSKHQKREICINLRPVHDQNS